MQESYQCLSLNINLDDLDIDEGYLYDHGCLGLIEEGKKENGVLIKAYFPDDQALANRIAHLKKQLKGLRSIEATLIALSADSFKEATYGPFLLTPDVWIIPPSDLATDVNVHNEPALIIRPGMAFGTGRHETTQLVAMAIQQLPTDTSSLLDVGSGSGILAILARKCGIPQVDAVEISEDARRNAEGNFDVHGIRLFASLQEVPEKYAVVVANILTPTILNLQRNLLRVLKTGGQLILSGITSDEAGQIEQAFSSLKLIKKTEKNDWCCYVYANGTLRQAQGAS